MNLKRRLELIERKLRPGELAAVIQGDSDYDGESVPFVDADDPCLHEGVDENGEALISRWACVRFFEGTRDQQDARLRELRLDPYFQRPWKDGQIPIRFEGGATCEDVYARMSETEQRDKLLPSTS